MRGCFHLLEDESDDEEDSYIMKNVVVVGKKRSGKTSIITRLIRNTFTLCYTPTKAIEIYEPVLIGTKYYKFYEIPYDYDFNHKWCIDVNVIFIVEDIDTSWWVKLLDTVNQHMALDVFFVTQKKNLNDKHREYHVDALAFSGFSDLMYTISQL